jgi:phenylacetate-coenzyme A ligase PaaK-like adenylate-forming protein
MRYDSDHHRLLARYAQCRRQQAQGELAGEPQRRAAAADQVETQLYEHWRERGWDPTELMKIVRQIDYRERVMALYDGPSILIATEGYERAEARQRALASELQAFWTASGHDLKELDRFLFRGRRRCDRPAAKVAMQQNTVTELRLLLEHARRTTPYWMSRVPDLPSYVADARELLADIPLLARGDVQRERARLWSAEGEQSEWRAVRTTGTTGEPVEVMVDRAARRVELETVAAHLDRCVGSTAWRHHDLVHLTLHPGVRSTAGPSPFDEGAQLVKWNLLHPWQASEAAFLACLRHLHGRVVTTMPSVIELLADRILAARSQRPAVPLLVVLSGEQVDSPVRALAGEAFNCPVTSMYTLAEAGVVASECPDTRGYHVEEHAAVVEILDEHGAPAPSAVDGEIVVTPIPNRAMPLLRYRTGDRGRRAGTPCGCGRSADLFHLVGGRRPARLVAASGGVVNAVRFAKLLASLDVGRIELGQADDGAVEVRYWSDRVLDVGARVLVTAALRGALGPEVPVMVRRANAALAAENPVGSRPVGRRDRARAEPEGPSPQEIAAWLQRELEPHTDIEAAVITGSSLDPEATTRFSDVDLVLLVRGEVDHPAWVELARYLRRHVPRLRVNVDRLQDLSARAPLLACRLLTEQLRVLGRLGLAQLPWPRAEDLHREAELWRQGAGAVLFSRLVDPDTTGRDPLEEAWIASRYGLDALRYHYIARGSRQTAARTVVGLALRDRSAGWSGLSDLVEAYDVAREHKPPPPIRSGAAERYLEAALACVRTAAKTTC